MDYVQYRTAERIAYITLNRPEKRNALNFEVVRQLKHAFDFAENDEACKVIVLQATGEVFCAGVDLAYMQTLAQNTFDENLYDSSHLMQLFRQIYTLKKVVIAKVHGHAIAGGCGLASICDLVFSVPEARFGYTEVKIGFVPAIVSVFLLRKIGEACTKQLLLTGDLVSAAKAQEIGLINYIIPAPDLNQAVDDFARKLCQENSAQSMEMIKEMLYRLPDMKLNRSLDYAAEMNALARGTADCQRGMAAFLQKEKFWW
ncbi:enoyl-CoA hydratase/isomerase family protein [Adhaeribacter rhizoryzae]|uniref:Enoyl-CoA hydratase/isomerase family protein n=1 Tax=Adhaeribacter rhizoryzae TaxID=2607907 RepID=A0A5M6DPC7_9BACT|nr:enoyl-CoA hydratase/isomerase family protein [Adhaeribacter rhizoryzae]KAA5549324.1 enoyl-CoA hydratase/isomerase family protein [Adhaeribacter rhizoryzae]